MRPTASRREVTTRADRATAGRSIGTFRVESPWKVRTEGRLFSRITLKKSSRKDDITERFVATTLLLHHRDTGSERVSADSCHECLYQCLISFEERRKRCNVPRSDEPYSIPQRRRLLHLTVCRFGVPDSRSLPELPTSGLSTPPPRILHIICVQLTNSTSSS